MSQASPTAEKQLQLDLVIIGGGVAGLWFANRASQAGYRLALCESQALGGGQTLASQGMIHGGMKYTLAGAFTGASEAIADMPRHWRDCLCGQGDINLRHTRILSDHFYLWSSQSASSRLSTFLASKLTRGRVEPVADDRRPPLLRNSQFSGSLYRLDDLVIDSASLVANLANNIAGQHFHIDWQTAQLERDAQGQVSLLLRDSGLRIHAQRFVFCAGAGNAALLQQLQLSQPAMQLRPLQQVMLKHSLGFDFYGHCLGADTTPRLTISSHRLPEGERVWYLGGSLAERGANMDSDALIAMAQQELQTLFPWVNLSGASWATLPIARAEPRQPGFARPDNAFVAQAAGTSNLLVAWPTKLTLAPNLANNLLAQLPPPSAALGPAPLAQYLPPASLARPPWELAFAPGLSAEERLQLKFKHLHDDEEPA